MKPVNAEAILRRGMCSEICAALERECVRLGLLFARLGNVPLERSVKVSWEPDEIDGPRSPLLLKRARDAGLYVAGEASGASVDGVGARVVYDVVGTGPREILLRWRVEVEST